MLRELNRTFKKQIKEVDSCFREANAKYSEVGMMRTCESGLHLGRTATHPIYEHSQYSQLSKNEKFEALLYDDGYN